MSEQQESLLRKDEWTSGGIVFDDEGRVLLRKPTKGWGGFVWTFPKGVPDSLSHEVPERTALREVLEETGVIGEIIAPIPGEFESDTCFARYYLMRVSEVTGRWDRETEEICWATPEEAVALLSLTHSLKGRQRDLDVLAAALRLKSTDSTLATGDSQGFSAFKQGGTSKSSARARRSFSPKCGGETRLAGGCQGFRRA